MPRANVSAAIMALMIVLILFGSFVWNVPINDIKVHRKDLLVATQGRAFWIASAASRLSRTGSRAPANFSRPYLCAFSRSR